MLITTRYLVYPDGEEQEIEIDPPFNHLLDVNGNSVRLPISTTKMLAYRVHGVRRKEERGELRIYHLLELVTPAELIAYLR